MNAQAFVANEVIIHDVPQRMVHKASAGPDLSQQAEAVTGDLRTFLQRKVRGSLARQGFDVEYDAGQSSPVPALISGIIKDPGKLVEHSQAMAVHLHSVQTGVNPAGLLVVTLGTAGTEPAVSVLKVERDDGTRLQTEGTGQTRTLTMQFIDDLLITGRTRIFKSSVFVGASVADLDGRVADDQRGTDTNADVASFFLSSFLGCKLSQDPRVAMKLAFHATEAFIAEVVDDPERKTNYTLALLSQMLAPAKVFRPRDFADQCLEREDRTPYRTFLEARNILTDQAIQKDLSMIERRLQKVQMDFESGLMLIGRPDVLDEKVDVKKNKVVINDRVSGAHGK